MTSYLGGPNPVPYPENHPHDNSDSNGSIVSAVDAVYGDDTEHSAGGSSDSDSETSSDTTEPVTGHGQNAHFAEYLGVIPHPGATIGSSSSDSDSDFSDDTTDSDGSGSSTSDSSSSDDESVVFHPVIYRRRPREQRDLSKFHLFMDLMPELRAIVYRFAVVRKNPITPLELCPSRYITIRNEASFLEEADRRERRRQPPILRTNRLIRAEALPIYYRENIFDVANTVVVSGNMWPMYRYPDPASANVLRMIRTLAINMTVDQKEIAVINHVMHQLRTTITLNVEITILAQGKHLSIAFMDGAAIKRQGSKRVMKIAIAVKHIGEEYTLFVAQQMKRYMGEPPDAERRYDGHNLLRAAATMPARIDCTKGDPNWRMILPPRLRGWYKKTQLPPNFVPVPGQ